MTLFLQLLANGIVAGAVWALVALGFGLIYNTTRIFHIAHGVVYTIAAYAFYTFARLLKWPLFASVPLALAVAALVGMAMEGFVYFPLYRREASLGVALISSLGLYIFLENLIALIFGNETKVLSPGVEKSYHIGPIILTRIQILELVISVLLAVGFVLFLRATRAGRAIRALADNPNLVTVLGMDVRKLRLLAFGLGSALAAVASCLIAWDVGMDPHVGIDALLIGAVATIVGGIGVFGAPILGAFLLGLLQSIVIWKISARWVEAFVFGLLIVFLIFRPQGILGQRRRLEEA